MFERFTDRARRSLVLAQQASMEMGHGFLGCEHLVLGLVREGSGVAAVVLGRRGVDDAKVKAAIVERVGEQSPSDVTESAALASLGIDLAEVQRRLEDAFGAGALRPADAEPPFTPRAKAALERAVAESEKLEHGYVGTEHLLLALLGDDENVGRSIVVDLGIDFGETRRAILEIAAADYLRIRATEERHERFFRMMIDPTTRDAIKPIYEVMSHEIGAAQGKRFKARTETTKAFADEFEAAVDRAEEAAREAGLLSDQTAGA